MAEIYVRVSALTRSKSELGETKLYDWLKEHEEQLGQLVLYEEQENQLLVAFVKARDSLVEAVAHVGGVLEVGLTETGYELTGALTIHAEESLEKSGRLARSWPRFDVRADIRMPSGTALDASRLLAALGGEFIRVRGVEHRDDDVTDDEIYELACELCASDEIEARLEAESAVANALHEIGVEEPDVHAEAHEIGSGTDAWGAIVFVRG